MMADVEAVEVVVAHSERATLRVGEMFATPEILWRKPPVVWASRRPPRRGPGPRRVLRASREIGTHEQGAQIGPSGIGELVDADEPGVFVERSAAFQAFEYDGLDRLRSETVDESAHEEPADPSTVQRRFRGHSCDVRVRRQLVRQMRSTGAEQELVVDSLRLGDNRLRGLVERVTQSAFAWKCRHCYAYEVACGFDADQNRMS
jgi:hypothetical protein